jgi:hypothetical protein
MRGRFGLLFCLGGVTLFLYKLHVPEDGPQGEVVSGFERPRQDERQPEHEQGIL